MTSSIDMQWDCSAWNRFCSETQKLDRLITWHIHNSSWPSIWTPTDEIMFHCLLPATHCAKFQRLIETLAVSTLLDLFAFCDICSYRTGMALLTLTDVESAIRHSKWQIFKRDADITFQSWNTAIPTAALIFSNMPDSFWDKMTLPDAVWIPKIKMRTCRL